MTQIQNLAPGVTLRCIQDDRFKHGALSIQLLRPLSRQEAALNALLPAVLLRGCRGYADLRAVTLKLDDLYGASIGALVRKVGDYQTTGFYCSFTEDRFAMEGDAILEPLTAFAGKLLLEPLTESGAFLPAVVESEKTNLISTIESNLNNKRAYAMEKLMRSMCGDDPFGIPRLGEKEDVAAITPQALYAHYQKILAESPVQLFYVGSQDADQVARLLKPLFPGRQAIALAPQTPFRGGQPSETSEALSVTQGKLCMSFVTPITIRDEDFVAMQMLNVVFGGGMTCKLFDTIREKLSLCYAIGSSYHGSKGILTVSAGIDFEKEMQVRSEVLRLLQDCREGRISDEELTAAREALRTSLESVHDSPGAMENFYASGALSGLKLSAQQYMQQAMACTARDLARVANTLQPHSVFFLKGVTA